MHATRAGMNISSLASSVYPRCAWRMSRSQVTEDLLLLPLLRMIANGTGGTFVELGALDGEYFSNTYVLEQCYNWTGTLIEANLANYLLLKARGDRPRSAKLWSAVCSTPGRVNITVQGGEMAFAPDTLSQRAKAVYDRLFHRMPDVGQVISTPCAPLPYLLEIAQGKPEADFLSLDVEGAEETVLSTLNPRNFKLIMVEMTGWDSQKDARVHQLLTNASMIQTLAWQVPHSNVYLRDDILESDPVWSEARYYRQSATNNEMEPHDESVQHAIREMRLRQRHFFDQRNAMGGGSPIHKKPDDLLPPLGARFLPRKPAPRARTQQLNRTQGQTLHIQLPAKQYSRHPAPWHMAPERSKHHPSTAALEGPNGPAPGAHAPMRDAASQHNKHHRSTAAEMHGPDGPGPNDSTQLNSTQVDTSPSDGG